jgi:hypothetical protein
VHNCDSLTTYISGILECISQNFLASPFGNELNTLYHTRDDNVFNSTVFTFCVFTDEDSVDIGIGGFISLNGTTRTDIGKE